MTNSDQETQHEPGSHQKTARVSYRALSHSDSESCPNSLLLDTETVMRRLCVARASRLVQTVAKWHDAWSAPPRGEDDHASGVAAIENGTSMCHPSREAGHRLAPLVLGCPPPSTGEGVVLLCKEVGLRIS